MKTLEERKAAILMKAEQDMLAAEKVYSIEKHLPTPAEGYEWFIYVHPLYGRVAVAKYKASRFMETVPMDEVLRIAKGAPSVPLCEVRQDTMVSHVTRSFYEDDVRFEKEYGRGRKTDMTPVADLLLVVDHFGTSLEWHTETPAGPVGVEVEVTPWGNPFGRWVGKAVTSACHTVLRYENEDLSYLDAMKNGALRPIRYSSGSNDVRKRLIGRWKEGTALELIERAYGSMKKEG